MKKIFIACVAVCAAMAFTACGSSKESAYRKAYEKAKAQEMAQSQQTVTQTVAQAVEKQAPVVTPLEQAPAQQTVQTATNTVSYAKENLQIVDGAGLKAYSVVVGSYTLKANAEQEISRLKASGYAPQLAYNQDRNMYRVIISTFDDRDNAVKSRDSLKGKYPAAWLLAK